MYQLIITTKTSTVAIECDNWDKAAALTELHVKSGDTVTVAQS